MKNTLLYFVANCLVCNKPFIIKISKQKQSKNGGTFCSTRCRGFYNFKRIKFIDKNGYVRIPIYSNNKVNQLYEHREIMVAWLGRELKDNEIIHHKDHNKTNNSLCNLEIMSSSDHAKHHHSKYVGISCSKCNKKAIKIGLCNAHYLKQWKIKKYNRLGKAVIAK